MAARRSLFAFALLALLLAACRKAEITSYRAPKDKEPELPPMAAAMPPADGAPTDAPGMAGTAVPTAEGPSLTWSAPGDWKAKPTSAMRKGSFTVPGEGGADADLSITAFPGDVGGEAANVNRWRGQLQLPPLGEAELASAVTRVTHNGLAFAVVDFVSADATNPQRMIGAMAPADGATWFFKLTGPDATVAKAKPAFEAFLQTITSNRAPKDKEPESQPMAAAMPPAFGAPGAAPGMAGTAVPTAGGPGLTWSAPADWKAKPASAMRKGSYAVPGNGGADADLSITAFPGDVGGEAANVNRWRGQLQLPPLGEAKLASAVTRVAHNGLTFAVVDFTSAGATNPQRMLGAMAPVDGATWFFKLTGPDATVAKAKPAFEAFLQTIKTSAPTAP